MTSVKLTKTGVAKRKSRSGNREEIPDALLPGLYLIVQPSGSKSWAVRYRWRGKPIKHTLGKYPVLDLDEARDLARSTLRSVEMGKDPRVEKRLAKEAPSDSVENVVEDFITRYVRKENRPRSAAESIRALRKRVVPAWRGRSISEITRLDIIELLDDIAAETPATAIRTKATISALFNWSLDRGIVDMSPAVRLKSPATMLERERVLSDGELKQVWEAFDQLGEPFGPYFQTLLLTGQRRTEVATMRWDHLDPDNALWTIPAELTKANRKHEVPLSPMVIDLLSRMNRLGDYVFTTRGDRPISGFSKAKSRVEKATSISEPWRVHDLRRTCGTGMASLRVNRLVISKVLNHSEGGVTKIYDRDPRDDEKKEALIAWGRYVKLIVDDVLPVAEKKIRAANGRKEAEAEFRGKIMASDCEWQRYVDTLLGTVSNNVVELATA